jgi:hypothetical protein
MTTKKQPETLPEQIIAAGFKEVNASGEAVKGSDYSHGWHSMDGRKRHLHLAHKDGRRAELELVYNGGGDPLRRIALYNGDQEVMVTTTGVVRDEVLKSFLG